MASKWDLILKPFTACIMAFLLFRSIMLQNSMKIGAIECYLFWVLMKTKTFVHEILRKIDIHWLHPVLMYNYIWYFQLHNSIHTFLVALLWPNTLSWLWKFFLVFTTWQYTKKGDYSEKWSFFSSPLAWCWRKWNYVQYIYKKGSRESYIWIS